jgi:hypothetical protein
MHPHAAKPGHSSSHDPDQVANNARHHQALMSVTILMAGVDNRMKSGGFAYATRRLPIFWALAAIVPVPRPK